MGMAEQAAMAIKAGCQWLEIDTENLSDIQIQTLADEIIPECRESGVILVFRHHDIMVDKLRVHGIRLSDEDKSPLELRERFGGHAIIGVEVTNESDFAMLKRADVDYVVVKSIVPVEIAAVKVKMTNVGVNIPIVAEGKISQEDYMSLLSAGASGYNIDITSLKGPEYEGSLRGMIDTLPM